MQVKAGVEDNERRPSGWATWGPGGLRGGAPETGVGEKGSMSGEKEPEVQDAEPDQGGEEREGARKRRRKYNSEEYDLELVEDEEDLSSNDLSWVPESKKMKNLLKEEAGISECASEMSPEVQDVMHELNLHPGDPMKKRHVLNHKIASLAVHRWAWKTQFPILEQPLMPANFKEVIMLYGKQGSGLVLASETTLSKAWKAICKGEKVHSQEECSFCDREWDSTRGDRVGHDVEVDGLSIVGSNLPTCEDDISEVQVSP